MQPSPSPPSTTSTSTPSSSPFLAHQINSTTRSIHTTLNKRILQLLPLALPPHANNASLYAHGMSYILSIYSTFETFFSQLLALPSPRRTPLIEALAGLHIPALERTSRLQEDLNHLSPALQPPLPTPSSSSSIPSIPTFPCPHSEGDGIAHEKDHPCAPPPPPPPPPLDPTPRPAPLLHLADFTTHISTTLSTHPHLLLSYTHIFYLALFSGGRHIRASLRSASGSSSAFPAKREEKEVQEKQDQDEEEGLQFWTFEGDKDGEDLKEEFKSRWAVVAGLLDEREKEQVVDEAVRVMESMVGIVGEIEGIVAGGGEGADGEVSGRGSGVKSKSNSKIWEGKGRINDHIDESIDDAKLHTPSTWSMARNTTRTPQRPEKRDVSEVWLLLKHLLPLGLADLLLAGFRALLQSSFPLPARGEAREKKSDWREKRFEKRSVAASTGGR